MRYWIAFLCLYSFSLFSVEHVYLKTPDFSRENIIGTKAGVRPYRKSGVRIEAETIEDKLIIHNYGYGGSGLTLCFGGAQEVLDILNEQNICANSVAILGSGVAGLACAFDLLEQGYEVHIYADAWSPHLTSNVAAGMWTPYPPHANISEEKKKFHARMLENSKSRLLKSIGDSKEFSGVGFISAYRFWMPSSHETISTKHQGEEVIAHFDNGVIKKGRRISEIGLDGKIFIEDLFNKVKQKGAKLHQHHFENLEDILSLEEPIIINCTSMGSRQLFNDQDFIPIRGQIVYFKPQEGVDYLFYQNTPETPNYWVSIFPWQDRLTLGGVYEYDQEKAEVNLEAVYKIIDIANECLTKDLYD